MDSDFSAKLKSVLSDPEALAKITAIASSMMQPEKPSPSQPASPPEPEPGLDVGSPSVNGDIPALAQNLTQNFSPRADDPRLALLYSLKPLLREDKRDRIDALTRALTVASMMKSFRK